MTLLRLEALGSEADGASREPSDARGDEINTSSRSSRRPSTRTTSNTPEESGSASSAVGSSHRSAVMYDARTMRLRVRPSSSAAATDSEAEGSDESASAKASPTASFAATAVSQRSSSPKSALGAAVQSSHGGSSRGTWITDTSHQSPDPAT